MGMSTRKDKLLVLLESNGSWITGKELAQMLNVSDRTIRSDIEAINRENEDTLIESNIRKGYRLNLEHYNKIKVSQQQDIPQTSKERCNYILQKLLVKKQEINITNLLSEIYISEYSLDNDLKRLKEIIAPYDDLSLVKTKNHLCLVGSEKSKRNLYKQLLLAETQKNFLNINEIAALYKNFDLLRAKSELESILKKYHYAVSDVSFPSLMVHVGVSIERILSFNYVETIRDSQEIRDSVEYQISKAFYERISKLYHTEIIESEIILLALLLMGKKGTNYSSKSIAPYINGVSSEEIVEKLLDYIKERFAIDFTHDEELQVGLTLHISSLIERVIKKLKIDNVYLQEIKRRYPMIFELALTSTNYISNRIHLEIEEAEIGFIALHLGMAYERLNSNKKFKVALIFPRTQAISDAPEQRINHIFGEYIELIGRFNYFEEKVIKNLKPDLLICSIPLKHNLDIPTVQISVFMNREDESKIFAVLNELENKRLKDEYSDHLKEIIKKEHFFVDMNFKNPDEIIEFMCEDLKKAGAIGEDFYENVLEREKISSTSFIYNFAIPHSIDSAVYESNISIVLLKKPVQWGLYEVKIIFLLAVEKTDSDTMKLFFEWMTNLSNDIGRLTSLLECKSYEEFIKFLN